MTPKHKPDDRDHLLDEIRMQVRGKFQTANPREADLGTEIDDRGFVSVTLTHGQTKRLLALEPLMHPDR